MKIVYTRGNRTETLASLATLRKILTGSLRTGSFMKSPAATNAVNEFFSTKNMFVVGLIEVTTSST